MPAPGVTESQSGNSASLTWTIPGGVAPGLRSLDPSEFGPYPSTGFSPVYPEPGQRASIPLTITPSTAPRRS